MNTSKVIMYKRFVMIVVSLSAVQKGNVISTVLNSGTKYYHQQPEKPKVRKSSMPKTMSAPHPLQCNLTSSHIHNEAAQLTRVSFDLILL